MLLAVVPEVASAESLCTDSLNVAEGKWSTLADWSAGHVPEASNVACVGIEKTFTVDGTDVAGVVQGQGTVAIPTGSLEVGNALETSVIHSISLTGGTLTGAATVEVSGALTWEGGGMTGSGETFVQSGATAAMSNVYIEGSRVVLNEGTATLGSNTFSMAGAVAARSDSRSLPRWAVSPRRAKRRALAVGREVEGILVRPGAQRDYG